MKKKNKFIVAGLATMSLIAIPLGIILPMNAATSQTQAKNGSDANENNTNSLAKPEITAITALGKTTMPEEIETAVEKAGQGKKGSLAKQITTLQKFFNITNASNIASISLEGHDQWGAINIDGTYYTTTEKVRNETFPFVQGTLWEGLAKELKTTEYVTIVSKGISKIDCKAQDVIDNITAAVVGKTDSEAIAKATLPLISPYINISNDSRLYSLNVAINADDPTKIDITYETYTSTLNGKVENLSKHVLEQKVVTVTGFEAK